MTEIELFQGCQTLLLKQSESLPFFIGLLDNIFHHFQPTKQRQCKFKQNPFVNALSSLGQTFLVICKVNRLAHLLS